MVALEPAPTLVPETPAPQRPEWLAEDDRQLLERIAGHLPLLTDLTHADAVLFARAGDQVTVLAQAQPVPVPSPYSQPLTVGRLLTRDEAPTVFRVLLDGH